MGNLIPIIAIVGFAVVLIVVLRRDLLPHRRKSLTNSMLGAGNDLQQAERIAQTVRRRNLAAVIVAVLGGIATLVLHQVFIKSGGLTLVAAPATIWVLVVLVLICWPIPYEPKTESVNTGTRVSAGLIPRTTSMFGPAWGLVLPLVLFAVSILGIVVAGILSSTDDRGLYRQITFQSANEAVVDENMVVTQNIMGVSSTGPFPGWYYGLPVAILLVLGLLLTLLALNKNTRRPSLRGESLIEFDAAVRTHNGYVLSSGFSAFLCLQAVPLLWMAAAAVYNMSQRATYIVGQKVDEGAGAEVSYDPWQVAFSWSLSGLGVLMLIVGIVLLGYLISSVLSAYGAGSKSRNAQLGSPA
ncbi:hypothetical protein [Arthrobacter sp. NIO-1057]|uniref:hypothetical protein n=1 Tax=Arthrobacter sp. NIO-1057 TaxID=993071 RepID=UPI00071CFC6B|nr:hypothetical protein [Arthrobacter sp. NIO-1057]KSU66510.1 hypothetical protein AS038_07500 [Arthrobacter sp. NIO-1057]SCC16317.1 hypothetical protein GA0061084_1520 [Arthrobacter sp. NIO-1057]